jgi:superfamily II DNA/RNA helicase
MGTRGLYAEFKSNNVVLSFEEAKCVLGKLDPSSGAFSVSKQRSIQSDWNPLSEENETKMEPSGKSATPRAPPQNSMWGTMSVGPILRSRIVDKAGLESPTKIQEAAYPIIIKGKNAVIASPTGTGKTLSFLIPLLSKFGLKTPFVVIILTPTLELACQIKRDLEERLGYQDLGVEGTVLHVVGRNKSDDPKPGEILELLPTIGKAPFLASTPKLFRQLTSEAKSVSKYSPLYKSAEALLSNPRCIVLDEADRLLQTEQRARDSLAKRSGSTRITSHKKGSSLSTSAAEAFLNELPLGNKQLICASATVGRTLRQQVWEIVGSPSIDQAAVLITADDRTKKDAALRQSSWTPSNLSHWYRLIPDNIEVDDAEHEAAIHALWICMQQLEPDKAIVFPGRAGVIQVQERLQACGLKNVLTLRDPLDTVKKMSPTGTWQETAIFVVGEKFGRGLDIPDVNYVFLLSPPSSAAAYAHLAGRTGRNQSKGKVVTLVRPKEANKIVSIASALGLCFSSVDEIPACMDS